jgi:AcrR family transcriptional regulator
MHNTVPYCQKQMRNNRRLTVKPRIVLDREQWVDAAVSALQRNGLAAVAVEPLAMALGVTKGSFYWHFANRDALISALVARWAQQGTEEVIVNLNTIADPVIRLTTLFHISLGDLANLRAEAALNSAAVLRDPIIAPTARKVMQRRLSFTESCYLALGFVPSEARRYAVIAYGTFLGCVQLASHDLLASSNEGLQHQLALVQRVLVDAPLAALRKQKILRRGR